MTGRYKPRITGRESNNEERQRQIKGTSTDTYRSECRLVAMQPKCHRTKVIKGGSLDL